MTDVLGAKEYYADVLTGEASTSVEAASECAEGDVPWEEWTEGHDDECSTSQHHFSSTHGSVGGELAFLTGSDAGNVRVIRGQLLIDGDVAGECQPALGSDGVCAIKIGMTASSPGCMEVRAVSQLNTGSTHEVVLVGPWTYC